MDQESKDLLKIEKSHEELRRKVDDRASAEIILKDALTLLNEKVKKLTEDNSNLEISFQGIGEATVLLGEKVEKLREDGESKGVD